MRLILNNRFVRLNSNQLNQTCNAMKRTALLLLRASFVVHQSRATERYFGYTYEPETMPKGAMEYEQWVTLRAGRNTTVGQQNYNKWEIREELEYGVSDRYTVALYLNQSSE